MKISLESVNFNYGNGEVKDVTINGSSKNADRSLRSYHKIKLSKEEYDNNSSTESLKNIIKDHAIEEWTKEPEENDESDDDGD